MSQYPEAWKFTSTRRGAIIQPLQLPRLTPNEMLESNLPSRLLFDSFELNLRTRELRKDGSLIKLQDQPIKLLVLLAGRAGDLVTREEIEKSLWNEDQFVEFEHGINTAMRKIREALGDDPEKPRFIETLPRKGYRFLVSVQAADDPILPSQSFAAAGLQAHEVPAAAAGAPLPASERRQSPANQAATAEFAMPRCTARMLFLAIQAGYLAMYCTALYKMESLEEVLARVLLLPAGRAVTVIIVSAMCGIAVRLYLTTSVGLDHPAAGEKFRQLFPWLFILDTFWAASPLLLVRRIGYGLALASVAALEYLPFVQRTLMRSICRSPKASGAAVSQT